METVKRDVLFYPVHPLYDTFCHDETATAQPMPDGHSGNASDAAPWKKTTAINSLMQIEGKIFSKVIVMYRLTWEKLALQVGAGVAARYGVEVEYMVIPTSDEDTKQDIVEFFYTFSTAYPFDYDAEEYYIFSNSLDAIARIYTYYLVTLHIFNLTFVSLPFGLDPAKVIIIPPDLRYYSALTNAILQNKGNPQEYLRAGIKTVDPVYNLTMERAARLAARSRDPILIDGPSGAGKSTLARRIYEVRKAMGLCSGVFVEMTCAALGGGKGMSYLFGHTRGAFSGAMRAREGALAMAHRGVLFLNEIGELGLEEQALLLRALEDHCYCPLGTDKEQTSDFMLMCSTSQNLMVEARAGRFRSDLLARINLWHLPLPHLRDRRADIPANLDYELDLQAQRMGSVFEFAPGARERYLSVAMSPETLWENNFRSFSSSVRRMCTIADNGVIDRGNVEAEIVYLSSYRSEWNKASADPVYAFPLVRALLGDQELESLDYFDSTQLENVLGICIQNRSLAESGRALFRQSRLKKGAVNDSDRIRKYLARYNLAWSDVEQVRKQAIT